MIKIYFTKITLLVIVLGISISVKAQQTGIIVGATSDKNTGETLVGVTIVVEGSSPVIGTASNIEGNYKLDLPIGTYILKATLIGYKEIKKFNVVLNSGNTSIVNFELEEELQVLNEVVIQGGKAAAVATLENPISIQKLTSEEIKSNPGGNFDISRVIQSLPGVGGSTGTGGFRNDILIRGGAPNENVFYLDGIEVPVINHFTTQGSSGGPQGILNVSFIEDVTLSTSAFGAKFDNPLSSVFQFKQKDGNKERLQGNVRLSGTELAATFDGPISKKTTFLASARRSYLQYFFQLIDLPIRPSYWDFQYKVTHRLNSKTTLTAIGVGAIDEFSFAVPKNTTPEKEYAIRSNPTVNQNTYTLGLSLKRQIDNGYINIALSRNYFNNRLDKFEDGQTGNESLRTLRVNSDEIENKLRIDVNQSFKGWKYSYGAMAQFVQFKNAIYSKVRKELLDSQGSIIQPGVAINFDSEIQFFKYGLFFQATKTLLNNRLSISPGIRSDINTFTKDGNKPLETLSPRISFSYALTGKWNVNASFGQYYKIPIYTVLGFKDLQGNYINNTSKYTSSTHYVAGVEYLPNDGLRITAEGFYKDYANYPISLNRGVSLANEGTDFGAIGNEAIATSGNGRSYGVELFIQKKLTKNIYYVISYTYFKSEFSGSNGVFVSSSWDNQNLISGLLGRKFEKGWEIGLKYRYAGPAPYTPFDLSASQQNYLSLGVGITDVNQLNSNRLDSFNQFDFRIDKKWNYNRFTFDLYFDVQNALLFKTPTLPRYTFARNQDGSYQTTDGQPIQANGSNAVPFILGSGDPLVVPTLGFIVEF